MLKTISKFAAVAAVLLLAGCGPSLYTRVSGLDYVLWDVTAKTADCAEIRKRKNTFEAMDAGKFTTNFKSAVSGKTLRALRKAKRNARKATYREFNKRCISAG